MTASRPYIVLLIVIGCALCVTGTSIRRTRPAEKSDQREAKLATSTFVLLLRWFESQRRRGRHLPLTNSPTTPHPIKPVSTPRLATLISQDKKPKQYIG
ncbi:hypothetical protein LSAT2_008433 [Lamellibrachia satsuma]|nr:hypothetical protein LSAT2_008433 [Lamellibrachia satsuma]